MRNIPLENEDEDLVGQVYKFQPYDADLEGDVTESDPEDLTSDEIQILQQSLNNRSSIRRRTRAEDDTLDALGDDFESYLRATDQGNLVDIFDEED